MINLALDLFNLAEQTDATFQLTSAKTYDSCPCQSNTMLLQCKWRGNVIKGILSLVPMVRVREDC